MITAGITRSPTKKGKPEQCPEHRSEIVLHAPRHVRNTDVTDLIATYYQHIVLVTLDEGPLALVPTVFRMHPECPCWTCSAAMEHTKSIFTDA